MEFIGLPYNLEHCLLLIENYLVRYSSSMCSIPTRHPSHHFFYLSVATGGSPSRGTLCRDNATRQAQLQHKIQLQPPPAENTRKVSLGWGPGSQICALSISPQTWCFFFLLGGNGGDESLMWVRHVVLKMYKFNVDVEQVMHWLQTAGPQQNGVRNSILSDIFVFCWWTWCSWGNKFQKIGSYWNECMYTHVLSKEV